MTQLQSYTNSFSATTELAISLKQPRSRASNWHCVPLLINLAKLRTTLLCIITLIAKGTECSLWRVHGAAHSRKLAKREGVHQMRHQLKSTCFFVFVWASYRWQCWCHSHSVTHSVHICLHQGFCTLVLELIIISLYSCFCTYRHWLPFWSTSKEKNQGNYVCTVMRGSAVVCTEVNNVLYCFRITGVSSYRL